MVLIKGGRRVRTREGDVGTEEAGVIGRRDHKESRWLWELKKQRNRFQEASRMNATLLTP